MAALAPLGPKTGIPYENVFLREVDCLRVVEAIHRVGACGGPLKRGFCERHRISLKAILSINNRPCKRASDGGGSGPLIPRSSGFNGGSCV